MPTSSVLDRPVNQTRLEAPDRDPAGPIPPDKALWIDRWCEEEGISARPPWWRRLFA